MNATSVTPVNAATAAATAPASAATGSAASKSGARPFDEILQQLRGGDTGQASGAGKASEDPTEDRFMKLLVAQMRNQDPLNPLDNAQVTSQLAQINTVKGIDKLNDALQKLVARGESGSAGEAAAMVGRRVLVEGNTLELPAQGSAQAGFELAAPASSVRIEVVGPGGSVVDTRVLSNLPAGLQTFDWDGKAGTERAEAGRYTLRVTATDGTDAVEATPFAAVPVRAVTRDADGVSLQLGPSGARRLDEVRAIL